MNATIEVNAITYPVSLPILTSLYEFYRRMCNQSFEESQRSIHDTVIEYQKLQAHCQQRGFTPIKENLEEYLYGFLMAETDGAGFLATENPNFNPEDAC